MMVNTEHSSVGLVTTAFEILVKIPVDFDWGDLLESIMGLVPADTPSPELA